MNFDLSWTRENFRRVLWHAGVVATVAVAAFLAEELKTADFGDYTAIVVGLGSIGLKSLIEAVRKG